MFIMKKQRKNVSLEIKRIARYKCFSIDKRDNAKEGCHLPWYAILDKPHFIHFLITVTVLYCYNLEPLKVISLFTSDVHTTSMNIKWNVEEGDQSSFEV